MSQLLTLKEETRLAHPLFPFNIFRNSSRGHDVLFLHWHVHMELILILSGHATFHIGNQTYRTETGDLLFVNSNELHEGYSIDNTHVEYYALVFHPSLVASSDTDPFYKEYIAPVLGGKILLPHIVKAGQDSSTEAAEEIMKIVKEFGLKRAGYEYIVKKRLSLIFSHLCREAGAIPITSPGPELMVIERNPGFAQLFNYVEEHYKRKITLEQAARIVSLSPHHFCKKFKKLTGRTFVEYVNLFRVNQAEKLIRSTATPITEISEAVGFCNINYFDKVFKQYKLYSPSQYRKENG